VEEGVVDAAASVQAGMRGSLYGAEDIDVAKDMGFTVLTTDELRDLGAEEYGKLVLDTVGDRPVFMSFDIDFLDPAFAPGTGTPEVGGFSTADSALVPAGPARRQARRLRRRRGVAAVRRRGDADRARGGERRLRPPFASRDRRSAGGPRMSWLGDSAVLACLTFDVDAEAPILAESGLYARNAGVMSHQAYGPLVGVPRILDLLREYSLPATFFVPGWTADRYPQVVEAILSAGARGRASLVRPPLAVRPDPKTRSAPTSSARSPRCVPSVPTRRASAAPAGSPAGARRRSSRSTASSTTPR